MHSHRHALERLASFLDGLRTPIDGWQVAKQMQQIAREALGWAHSHRDVPDVMVSPPSRYDFTQRQTRYFKGDDPNAD